jgi:hypothetical protein
MRHTFSEVVWCRRHRLITHERAAEYRRRIRVGDVGFRIEFDGDPDAIAGYVTKDQARRADLDRSFREVAALYPDKIKVLDRARENMPRRPASARAPRGRRTTPRARSRAPAGSSKDDPPGLAQPPPRRLPAPLTAELRHLIRGELKRRAEALDERWQKDGYRECRRCARWLAGDEFAVGRASCETCERRRQAAAQRQLRQRRAAA